MYPTPKLSQRVRSPFPPHDRAVLCCWPCRSRGSHELIRLVVLLVALLVVAPVIVQWSRFNTLIEEALGRSTRPCEDQAYRCYNQNVKGRWHHHWNKLNVGSNDDASAASGGRGVCSLYVTNLVIARYQLTVMNIRM